MNGRHVPGRKIGRTYVKRLNRRDIALIILVLIAALAGFILEFTRTGRGAQLQISVNGEVLGVYDLNTNQTIEIGDGNVCRIEDGTAWMEWADCPDQLCVHHAHISRVNETVVCLPNRVTLTVIGGEEDGEIDTIVSELHVQQFIRDAAISAAA